MKERILEDYLTEFTRKQDALIMGILQKQKGFISLEKSKHLIEMNKMYRNDVHVGDDYIFDGKRFLTVYPPEFKEENGRFTISLTYLEY